MSDLHDIQRLASRQHGNISVAQLHEFGLSKHAIRARVASGWLIPRHRGVYALGHVPATRESRWMAAVLTFGEGAVLSHRSAAALWGILSGGVVTDVTVPTRAGHRRRDGLVVHRSPVSAHNVTVRRGIPVTTLLQTVLDVAAVVRVRRLHQVFEEAQVQHHLRPEVVAAEALCRRGYRGNARVWHTLEGSVDPSGVRSILELRFLRMCAAQGLPRPMVNARIGPWTPDFLWPDARLVVETDGDRFHRTAAKRARDAEKDAFMRGQGLQVLRLSWADVTHAPDVTGARVRELLRSPR